MMNVLFSILIQPTAPILEVRLTAELAYLFANSAPQFSEKNYGRCPKSDKVVTVNSLMQEPIFA